MHFKLAEIETMSVSVDVQRNSFGAILVSTKPFKCPNVVIYMLSH
jgi:hypothetical protein